MMEMSDVASSAGPPPPPPEAGGDDGVRTGSAVAGGRDRECRSGGRRTRMQVMEVMMGHHHDDS